MDFGFEISILENPDQVSHKNILMKEYRFKFMSVSKIPRKTKSSRLNEYFINVGFGLFYG